MIPPDFIQTLLNRVDIVEVVERYLPLKRAGSNLTACCPFHSEKSPSFTVSPSKQFYHCFGCGAHGTVISFLMEHAGLGFVEAVKELAAAAGMAVPEAVRSERQDAAPSGEPSPEELIQALQTAVDYYREQLKKSPQAIAYLKQRGLTGEIAARFGIGFAPPGWQNLAAVFSDYDAKTLLAAGLVIENDAGRRYDRFRDRIMFPIINARGAVIGFGGRVLGEGEPKYLNSPETALFEKGRELYGLYQARRAIRDQRQVIVVEGYMDVVALAQHGVENAVATLGTATSPTHVQKLLRQADSIVFCFDGDNAGKNAARRALEVSLPLISDGKEVRFLFLPMGEDPDSYVRSAGKQGFQSLAAQAKPLSAFLLDELVAGVDMQSEEGRVRLLERARPLLGQIGAPMLSLMLRKRLAELTGIGRDELDPLFRIKPAVRGRPQVRSPRRSPSLEAKLISLLLFQPALAETFTLALPDHSTGHRAALQALILALGQLPKPVVTSAVIEHFRHSPFEGTLRQGLAEALQLEADFSEEQSREEFKGACAQLATLLLKEQLDELNQKARHGGLSAEDKVAFLSLHQRLQKGVERAVGQGVSGVESNLQKNV